MATLHLRLATAITLSIGILATAANVEAREVQRSGGYSNSRGVTGNYQQRVERAPGRMTRDTEWQGRRGTGSAHAERTWERESGAAAGKRDVELSNGKSASRTWQASRQDDGSHNVTATREGFSGNTSSYAGTRQRNADGSVASSGTLTGENGRSATVDATRATGDDGWNSNATVTGGNGASYKRSASVAAGDSEVTRTVTVTSPDGEARTHSTTATVTATRHGNTEYAADVSSDGVTNNAQLK